MKRLTRLGLLSAILAALLCAVAFGETKPLQVVSCPQQGFTTACEAGLKWAWDDRYGLTVYTGVSEDAACLTIWVTGSKGADFQGYFDGTLTPWMSDLLGDDLLEVSPFSTYELEDGIRLPGVMYVYLDAVGRREVLFRLFDTRWSANVCYTLRYPESAADDTLRALGIAVTRFSPAGA